MGAHNVQKSKYLGLHSFPRSFDSKFIHPELIYKASFVLTFCKIASHVLHTAQCSAPFSRRSLSLQQALTYFGLLWADNLRRRSFALFQHQAVVVLQDGYLCWEAPPFFALLISNQGIHWDKITLLFQNNPAYYWSAPLNQGSGFSISKTVYCLEMGRTGLPLLEQLGCRSLRQINCLVSSELVGERITLASLLHQTDAFSTFLQTKLEVRK